ncbi:hypothetical protein SRIMM317S_04146 [Streptomyces rimosus subsp. rimosus]
MTKIFGRASPPVVDEKTTDLPSGDQLASVCSPATVVSLRTPLPSAFITYNAQASLPSSRRWKTRRSPRGDQLGSRLSVRLAGPFTGRVCSVPSRLTFHREPSADRSASAAFSSGSSRSTLSWKTIHFPSGEKLGLQIP